MKTKEYKIKLGEKDLIIQEGIATKANGSVFVRYGDTEILATCVMSDTETKNTDFFPLNVEYQERYYAAGKILGSRFIRRESRPSEEAILTARMIDRAIRPLFPSWLKREVQVVVTCLSWDGENDPDILGVLGASLALLISDIPWEGPIGVARVAKKGKEFFLNPTYQIREEEKFETTFSGVFSQNTDDILINMIEMEGDEAGEEEILESYEFCLPYLKSLIDFQKKIREEIGKEKIKKEEGGEFESEEVEKEIKDFLKGKIEKAIYQKDPLSQKEKFFSLKKQLFDYLKEKYQSEEVLVLGGEVFKKEVSEVVRQNILNKELRPDFRKLNEIREIEIEVGVLPRTHGSALFSRGETKALSILTLGAPGDVKLLEGMEIRGKKRFMHHYNFPPYCSGEIKPFRGPSRREIGHGMLVERALLPLVPTFEQFPYTMRIVTEILSSNGSTSMASVCASSLALMDAGVPIKKPAAGIAIGLVTSDDGKNYKLLADIQGPEDHHGEMDFKVAGTEDGITAIQMDVKIKGITREILKDALDLAKKCRLKILEKMKQVLPSPRSSLSPYAPRIYTLQIKPEKIREVIGPGGRVIHEIIEKCEVSIDIEETGKIYITAEKEEAAKKALAWIKNITREIKVGEVFLGKVKRILNFGAIVELLPGQEGLIHISQLKQFRIKKVDDLFKIGDVVPVRVINIDEHGRINLSLNKSKLPFKMRKKMRK